MFALVSKQQFRHGDRECLSERMLIASILAGVTMIFHTVSSGRVPSSR